MRFDDNIFIGKTVGNPAETLDMLRNGVGVYDVYVIYVNHKNDTLLEMVESTRLFSQPLTQKNAEPIAIANGRQEALCFVKDVIANSLDALGNAKTFKKRLARGGRG